jgi:hypothetical protein
MAFAHLHQILDLSQWFFAARPLSFPNLYEPLRYCRCALGRPHFDAFLAISHSSSLDDEHSYGLEKSHKSPGHMRNVAGS